MERCSLSPNGSKSRANTQRRESSNATILEILQVCRSLEVSISYSINKPGSLLILTPTYSNLLIVSVCPWVMVLQSLLSTNGWLLTTSPRNWSSHHHRSASQPLMLRMFNKPVAGRVSSFSNYGYCLFWLLPFQCDYWAIYCGPKPRNLGQQHALIGWLVGGVSPEIHGAIGLKGCGMTRKSERVRFTS